MRVRETRNGFVQTAKAGNELIERSEWEAPVAGPQPDLRALRKTPLAKVLGKDSELAALFTVVVERATFDVEHGGSRIEVALDRGRISAPGATREQAGTTIGEVELELKSGSTADLFDLARELAGLAPLRLGVRSKAERGFALVDGSVEGVRKAEPVGLSDELTAAEAFQGIAHACLRHMRLNQDILLNHRDAEALHQVRVAIRRLRSAFSLFGDLVEDDRTAHVRVELKRLSEPLGRVRNLDVFLSDTLPAERKLHPDKVELLNLEKHLEAQRVEAYAAVMEGLRLTEWLRFVLDLISWIRRRRQVKKRGRDLEVLTAEDRHQVMITAKKLRYGAEFFAGLYTSKRELKRHKAFSAALSKLQDSRGGLNDIVTGHELIDDLIGKRTDASVSFAAGLTVADIESKSTKLLAEAARAHAELLEVRPFWL